MRECVFIHGDAWRPYSAPTSPSRTSDLAVIRTHGNARAHESARRNDEGKIVVEEKKKMREMRLSECTFTKIATTPKFYDASAVGVLRACVERV